MKIENEEKKRSNILIIDALNLFIRNYVVNPSLGVNGNPVGGSRGFLLSLQKYIKMFDIDVVYICWDGPGGSQKRREIVKEYKAGRKPIKMNNTLELSEEDQFQNKVWQQVRLMEYLNETPFFQFIYDDIEADDVVSFLTYLHSQDNKVIVSSDKDFFQLCTGRTMLYRPVTDKLYTGEKVVAEFGIHPTNMALARAIAGDSSDNLKGVPRVGLKTLANRFPKFKEKETYYVDDLITECRQTKKKLKVHKSILASKTIIDTNYSLMQLYSPNIPIKVKDDIKENIINHEFSYDYSEFKVKHTEDGIFDNFHSLLLTFMKMSKLRVSE